MTSDEWSSAPARAAADRLAHAVAAKHGRRSGRPLESFDLTKLHVQHMIDNTLVDAVTGKVAMPSAQKAHMLEMADTVHNPRMADGYRKLAGVAEVGLDVELTLATANQPDLKAIANDLGRSALWLREKAITRLLTRAAGADVGEVAKMSEPALRKAIEGADLETRRTLKAAVALWTAESATGRR